MGATPSRDGGGAFYMAPLAASSTRSAIRIRARSRGPLSPRAGLAYELHHLATQAREIDVSVPGLVGAAERFDLRSLLPRSGCEGTFGRALGHRERRHEAVQRQVGLVRGEHGGRGL